MKAKYIVFILLLIVVVVAGFITVGQFSRRLNVTQPAAPVNREVVGTPAAGDLVYVATAGDDVVYHQSRCAKLGGGGRPVTIKEAKKQGYKPCPVCMGGQSKSDK